MELADGVDLLVHDAQYTAHELPTRFTWGHAAADYAVTLGRAAGARTVLLFHHDPSRTDDQVFAMGDMLRGDEADPHAPTVEIATEGRVFSLGARRRG